MPFFSLTDIKIKDPTNTVTQGSLLPSPYESNVFRYPIDIGSLDKGHYMVIHINEQIKTQFKGTPVQSDLPTILENQKNYGTGQVVNTLGPDISNIVNDTRNSATFNDLTSAASEMWNRVNSFGVDYEVFRDLSEAAGSTKQYVKPAVEGVKEFIQDAAKNLASGQGLRTIQRTTDTIALYMPDTLNFTQNQSYSSMDLGGGGLALLGAAAAGYSYLKGKDSETIKKELTKNLSPFILSKGLNNLFGQNAGTALFAAASGTVINPQLELIYTSPSFREFRFDFMLYPRSSREAKEIYKLLHRLKFHQAPEILQEGSAGGLGAFFLVPPSEFDIKFYYNGRINPNIPPISTCILTSIDTDYAPNGWSAYEVPGDNGQPMIGRTGSPIGIKLSLVFQETELITKNNYRAQNSLVPDNYTLSNQWSVG
jgi:hypothetical protein